MRVLNRRQLVTAMERHAASRPAIKRWLLLTESSRWQSFQNVRQTFASADKVGVGSAAQYVFNIAGNRFRLIALVDFEEQTVFVQAVLTHAEYDKGGWRSS